MVALLAGFTVALGPLAMFNLYFMPYWINVMWLDAVTYLHHHGPEDEEKIPWYRGEVAAPPPLPTPLSLSNQCHYSVDACACIEHTFVHVKLCRVGETIMRRKHRVLLYVPLIVLRPNDCTRSACKSKLLHAIV